MHGPDRSPAAGLYEAVITEADPDSGNPKLVQGRYHFALERRTLNDIRALGCNDAEDDRRFATVARLSEVNEKSIPDLRPPGGPRRRQRRRSPMPYARCIRTGLALASSLTATRSWQPSRRSPKPSGRIGAPSRREQPLLAFEQTRIQLDRDKPEAMGTGAGCACRSNSFLNIYGSPLLQSLVGLNAENADLHRRIERDVGARSCCQSRFVPSWKAPLTAVASSRHCACARLTSRSRPEKWMTGVSLPYGKSAAWCRPEIVPASHFSGKSFVSSPSSCIWTRHVRSRLCRSSLPRLRIAASCLRVCTASESSDSLSSRKNNKRRLSRVEHLLAPPVPTRTARRENNRAERRGLANSVSVFPMKTHYRLLPH